MSELRDILDRVNRMMNLSDLRGWEDPARDAMILAIHAERLIAQVHNLNRLRPEPKDLCPACADDRWTRPSSAESANDWTRRKCSGCDEIRPEPAKGPESKQADEFIEGLQEAQQLLRKARLLLVGDALDAIGEDRIREILQEVAAGPCMCVHGKRCDPCVAKDMLKKAGGDAQA